MPYLGMHSTLCVAPVVLLADRGVALLATDTHSIVHDCGWAVPLPSQPQISTHTKVHPTSPIPATPMPAPSILGLLIPATCRYA